MKKLITTALLFAGLTMSAQDNFIAKLYDKFETSDTNHLDGVLFVPKSYMGFINEENKNDTIFVWFVVKYDTDYNLKLISLCFQSKYHCDNYDLLEDIKLVFENKTITFNLSEEMFSSLRDAYYITTKDKCKYEHFNYNIKSIKLKNKTFIPDVKHNVYFKYFLSDFEYLKFAWIK